MKYPTLGSANPGIVAVLMELSESTRDKDGSLGLQR